MVTLMNSPRLTEFGVYEYRPLTTAEAKRMLAEGFQSVVGHESTAAFLSDLLEVPVAKMRGEFRQRPGERAIVFELNDRPPEGHILDREEIERIGYKFGLLHRLG
jgi:hypothetical protein